MVRPVADDDIGLKVFRDPPADATQVVDIVAIHGIGAHPDDSWCKNVGTAEEPKWINWLNEEAMLPAIAPHACIMRYGYQSQWFGEGAMRQKASTVAQRLLLALRRKREEYPFRPLLFIAHCFGGLVVLKTLLEARQDENEWPGIFASTTGLIFFGTPFRGAEGMSQMEMLEAARREYDQDEVQPEVLKILEPGNEFLQELVDQFGKTRRETNKAAVACFYELKSSNVGRIVGKADRTSKRFVVSERSGCLDLSDATSKYSLSRTHFNMNKFRTATEEDFETVRDVIKKMIEASHGLIVARSQYNGKHKIDFSLRSIPVVSQFVQRDAEMRQIEHFLLEELAAKRRQRVVVVHGLGGIGKTQLAVEFARKHQHRFSGIFWLDGSSETSLKQSFADMMQRLPRDELMAYGVQMLAHSAVDVDEAVRGCLRWLSLSSNSQWLLIFDNVDRDFHENDDPQAYNVKEYFPHADHGSVLITSRLASLQRYGLGLTVETVDTQQARAILENSARREIKDADIILELLDGLPLALTQAGSYIGETNMSASTYTEHYHRTWDCLMQNQGRFPLKEYGDRSVLTTWTMSYEQVHKKSRKAAYLLKLWGFLDCGELWYELLATGSQLPKEIKMPTWLVEIAEDRLEYDDAVGILSRYSLANAQVETNSHSMHPVLHKWCGRLAEGEDGDKLGSVAVGIVASNVPLESEAEFWRKRKRLLAHATSVGRWMLARPMSTKDKSMGGSVEPWMFYRFGYLLAEEDRLKAGKMYQRALTGYEKVWGAEHTSTLDTVNNLGVLYKNLGRHDEAEKMYQRALAGKEKAWGAEHTSTLSTINNLGNLYADLGRHDEAEKMYQRALAGYEKAWGAEHTSTLDTVNNLGLLYKNLGRHDKAEKMYQRALAGKEKAWGAEHTSTLSTINNLGILYADLGRHDEAEKMYQRALQGYEKALQPQIFARYIPALNTIYNLGLLFAKENNRTQAIELFSRALSGYRNVLRIDHKYCQDAKKRLDTLQTSDETDFRADAPSESTGLAVSEPRSQSSTGKGTQVSRRRRFFQKLSWSR